MSRFEERDSFPERGDERDISPGSREQRQRKMTDEEVLASRVVGDQYDQMSEQDLLLRRAIEEDGVWRDIDTVIESRNSAADQNILSSSRELLGLLEVADAGSISFYHELQPLQPFITREPQLLERIIAEAKAVNEAVGKDYVTIDDLGRIISKRGVEEIEYEQTAEDVDFLIRMGVDRVELLRRLHVGEFREKQQVRSLARLLKEGPMQKFVKVIEYQVQEMGEEIGFDEVMVRAWGVIRRYNRQEAELAAGEERAVKRLKDRLADIDTKNRIKEELETYIKDLHQRKSPGS